MNSPDRFSRYQNSTVVTGSHIGPLVTASATPHTKGSWTVLISATSFDAYLAGVQVMSTVSANANTRTLIDIGVDPAGGTSYTVVIPNVQGGHADGNIPRAGTFPVFIPKGSQVAARCQSVVVSKQVRTGIVLLGGNNRSNPWPHRGLIQDYGSNLATSGGTAMAQAGSANAKSGWTQLGADTTRRHSGLAVSIASVSGGASTAFLALVDIGMDPAGGTAYTVIIPNIFVRTRNDESVQYPAVHSELFAVDIPAGASIATRAQSSVANSTDELGVIVYGF